MSARGARLLAIALAIAPAAAAVHASVEAAGFTVDALIARLARPAPAATDFIQADFSPLLARALIVTGRLDYLGPDHLSRTVRMPFQEHDDVHDDSVTVQRGGESPRQFSLQRVPQLRSLLASFPALLSGDRAALERQFTLDLHGDARAWTLGLTPRDPQVRALVRAILVSGRGAEPRCLTTYQASDSITVMLLGSAAQQSVPANVDLAWLEAQCRAAPH